MANTTHHLKSDLKHRKTQQQPKGQPVERMTQGPRTKPEPKRAPTEPSTGDVEEGFDAPDMQRPPADS